MPIFVSRYSSQRSLIGTFLSVRPGVGTRETAGQERQSRPSPPRTEAQRDPPPADRLDLSPPAIQAEANTRVPSRTDITPDDGQISAQPAETAANGPTGASTPEETLRRDIQRENQAAAQTLTPATLDTFIQRLDTLRQLQNVNRSAAAEENGVENQAAARNATPARLNALLETQNSAAEQPEELPPREAQARQLQQNLNAIASGLRTDAEIGTRQTAEQAARSSERTVEQSQSREIRENHSEIDSLQTDRHTFLQEIDSLQDQKRQLQQEIRRTDQAIRQLQSRNTQLRNSADGNQNLGNSLDLVVG